MLAEHRSPVWPQHSHGSQLRAPTSNPPHPQLPRCLSADCVSASRAQVVTTPSKVAHESIRGDAAIYHLREIGSHTKALIDEASRGFASLSLGILESVIKTFDKAHNDREIDPSHGVAEHRSVNDDDFFLDSPRSSLTTISYPPSPTPSSLYLDTEGDTTSLVSGNPSPDLVRIGGSEQSLDYCVACQRSFDSTSSVQSGSSRSSDRKCMPTTPAKVTRFPHRGIPSYNSLPVDMPSASRQASSSKPRNTFVRPGYRNPPRPTGQHYSVRPPPVASSRIPIATFYQRPSMIQHTRSSGTPGSSDTSPFDRRPPVYGRARGMGKTSDNRSSHSSQTTGSSIHSLSRDRHPRRSPK